MKQTGNKTCREWGKWVNAKKKTDERQKGNGGKESRNREVEGNEKKIKESENDFRQEYDGMKR